ncbi:LPXTG cell wall anchor domain-containing protein [Streptomyces sp. Amel2xC10]|uniref:LPXTG cell wall anchor domain-containing protein n=1 Tax=Streptomyces sp. Amel2xC10 TaxID=1305826 RepID=UPI000A089FCA|nr:LPXTG cell wall anchor domain-containing protein [Streptomyces sp. Amel2xC10]SMF13246.1 LPXTG-motif cell wall anchor domain-containing protein [Streptomyces sp. Amel2xC10]
MSSARRPLLTATAAGTLLGALWFVPSANASQDAPARTETTTQVTTQARAASTTTSSTASTTATTSTTTESGTATVTDATTTTDDGTRLADTGSFDTTPYVVGGTSLLALGAGFVVYSVRRERLGF